MLELYINHKKTLVKVLTINPIINNDIDIIYKLVHKYIKILSLLNYLANQINLNRGIYNYVLIAKIE